MNAVDYLKAKARMCEENTCYECRLTFDDWDRKSPCLDTERDKSEQAVAIVEQWAKENPVKTYLTVLLEKLPDTKISGESGTPEDFCPHSVFKIKKDFDYCNTNTCKDCWNREYQESKDDN